MRTRWLPVVALVTLLAVLGAGVALSRVPRETPAVPTAAASMPAETLRASVTDWARVRTLLDRPGAGAQALLTRAYDTDLSAVSALGDVVGVMEQAYGWSVLDAQWEGLAQSRRGAAVVVQLPPGFDLEVVRDGLTELGYLEPFESDGVWRGGADLLSGIDSRLTPLMAHAAVLDETHRVVFSDTPGYVRRTVQVVQGDVASLAQDESVGAVTEQLSDAVAAVVYAGEQGCRVMGFRRSSRIDRDLAEQRVAAVGGLQPYASVGMGLSAAAGGGVRRPPLVVAMHFADASALGDAAARRARLAVGEAPGQGGTFQSRFAVASAAQRGGDVVLRLRPHEVDAQLLSDFHAGQLLFASCG